ncbi:alpha/beta fold hydrolase [Rhizobium wenxiniae]|uniref:alpha/beta fold hydrolase n=1 Tax=Rhizobium wenxiniae TaxID=1737357 RepID=UPI001C6ECD25|nr:alpha/beta fold hydrolase [Rhizobium wenxiniae]MBW9087476.1 alpha/beta fold hydrolase [Rhizobium wenxiniae]
MSTVHFVFGALLAVWISSLGDVVIAQEAPIPPFKDNLFSSHKVLKSEDGGAYEVMDYNELRDINDRDQEPERRVRGAYVDTSVRRSQENETLMLGGRNVEVTRVGQSSGERFSVIFIHGRGGDRRLGVNDYSFGGNFNRLKNLVARNGGTYYSVSVRSFDDKGAADVGALLRHAFEQSSGRPVILACASMGGIVCQNIVRDREAVRYLGGMVLLGGPPDQGLATTPYAKLKLPIYFGHGSADSVYRAEDQEKIFRGLRATGYPARFALFQTGGHGTPIRMVDWRKVLNFVLVAHR